MKTKKCGCVSPEAKKALAHLSHESWEADIRGTGPWIRCKHRLPEPLMGELVKQNYLDTRKGGECKLTKGAYAKLLEWHENGWI